MTKIANSRIYVHNYLYNWNGDWWNNVHFCIYSHINLQQYEGLKTLIFWNIGLLSFEKKATEKWMFFRDHYTKKTPLKILISCNWGETFSVRKNPVSMFLVYWEQGMILHHVSIHLSHHHHIRIGGLRIPTLLKLYTFSNKTNYTGPN